MKASGNKRERGAYFTPKWVAEALAGWAIRTPQDKVLDPAAGRGDLLMAAAERLAELGGRVPIRLFGIELHKRSVLALRAALARYAPSGQLIHGDFFSVASMVPPCDVVLANPPYVRHHDIPSRAVTLMRATLDGRAHVVDGKASAWAYFLVQAPVLLKRHGRVAFVLPSEVLTSDYAAPIVEHIANRFRTVRLVYCDGVVFDDLSQQTVLCLAEDYDPHQESAGTSEWARLRIGSHEGKPNLDQVPYERLGKGATLARLLAPTEALKVERILRGRSDIRRLGDLSSVGIGYVTGSNQFFHLTELQRKRVGLAKRHLTRVVARSRELVGTAFTFQDWANVRSGGGACWLLTPKNSSDKKVRLLLQRGRRASINRAYKCKSRRCWWKVQTKEAPAALMSYMGGLPRVLANDAAVLVPNSLYELRELRGVRAVDVAVASLTSVFQLSAVLNARRLGGGLRKLEPSDAARILVPVGRIGADAKRRIESLLRSGKSDKAGQAADDVLLVNTLGWSADDVRQVRDALLALRGGSVPNFATGRRRVGSLRVRDGAVQ